MHELSICGSIADIVTRRADGRTVEIIHVRVGQLRQIVPDTLVFCWTVVSADTPLHGSRIEIENVRARIKCRGCGSVHEIGDYPILLCTICDGADVEILAGEEFDVTALDLAEV